MSDHADCDYWGLTRWQCARYHSRLARYFARRSTVHAENAHRAATWATRCAYLAVVALVVSFALKVLS